LGSTAAAWQTTDVAVLHDVVKQRVIPKRADGLKSLLPKFVPMNSIDGDPEVGPFTGLAIKSTGASYENFPAIEPI
jgi:hypothetical protein